MCMDINPILDGHIHEWKQGQLSTGDGQVNRSRIRRVIPDGTLMVEACET